MCSVKKKVHIGGIFADTSATGSYRSGSIKHASNASKTRMRSKALTKLRRMRFKTCVMSKLPFLFVNVSITVCILLLSINKKIHDADQGHKNHDRDIPNIHYLYHYKNT